MTLNIEAPLREVEELRHYAVLLSTSNILNKKEIVNTFFFIVISTALMAMKELCMLLLFGEYLRDRDSIIFGVGDGGTHEVGLPEVVDSVHGFLREPEHTDDHENEQD